MSTERQAHAFEIADRWPFWMGAQFFLGFLGVLSIMEKGEGIVFDGMPASPLVKLLVTAALSAVIFTWIMRRIRPRTGA